jgi:hypothetical protein
VNKQHQPLADIHTDHDRCSAGVPKFPLTLNSSPEHKHTDTSVASKETTPPVNNKSNVQQQQQHVIDAEARLAKLMAKKCEIDRANHSGIIHHLRS